MTYLIQEGTTANHNPSERIKRLNLLCPSRLTLKTQRLYMKQITREQFLKNQVKHMKEMLKTLSWMDPQTRKRINVNIQDAKNKLEQYRANKKLLSAF